jgi:hypothetical protein
MAKKRVGDKAERVLKLRKPLADRLGRGRADASRRRVVPVSLLRSASGGAVSARSVAL